MICGLIAQLFYYGLLILGGYVLPPTFALAKNAVIASLWSPPILKAGESLIAMPSFLETTDDWKMGPSHKFATVFAT